MVSNQGYHFFAGFFVAGFLAAVAFLAEGFLAAVFFSAAFPPSAFFGSWLLSHFGLLCNKLLYLSNFRFLNFFGLFSKLVAASSLLACSSSHLEGFSSYTLLQSCSHVYSS